MLCDQCYLRNASIHITNIRATSMFTRHLCQECAAEEPFNLMSMGGLMKGLVFVIQGTPETKQKTLPKQHKDLTCSQCHYRSSEFQKTQKLGCPACYEVFRELLTPAEIKHKEIPAPALPKEFIPCLNEDHNPGNSARAWELLQSELYRAIKEENYEEAARIRDQLRITFNFSHHKP